jgi:hypothetical protein
MKREREGKVLRVFPAVINDFLFHDRCIHKLTADVKDDYKRKDKRTAVNLSLLSNLSLLLAVELR